jgi:hypothetical protein
VSRIELDTGVNRLTAAYSFPDRARWHFENYHARVRSEHQYFYRFGEHVRAFEGSPSQDLEGARREGLVLQMELRRAVLFWPQGFEWECPSEEHRETTVFLDSCCREGPIGRLTVELEAGRPKRAEALDRARQRVETIEVLSWQERAGRSWPLAMAVEGGHGLFKETVESIDARMHLLDVSFVPPDRRPMPASSGGPRVQARDIVSMTHSPRPVPGSMSWAEAERFAREEMATCGPELERLGLTLEPIPMFEVDGEGRPARLFLRLAAPAHPAPPGFTTIPERPGLFLGLARTEDLGAPVLQSLLAAVPAGARPGAPYVRIHARKDIPVEVVLPIGPER